MMNNNNKKNYLDFLRGNQNSFGAAILLDLIALSTNHFMFYSAPDMYAFQFNNIVFTILYTSLDLYIIPYNVRQVILEYSSYSLCRSYLFSCITLTWYGS